MSADELPQLVLGIFVILVIVLALSSYIIGQDLSGLIAPLTDVFVPLFLFAVFIALIWTVASSLLG